MKAVLPLLLFFCFLSGSGQELPPFLNFEPSEYQAGNQNWMLAQAANGNIYIANGRGLLEYTGSKWNLYPMPNASIVRSVHTVADTVFTGAYMDFGYWTKNAVGVLEYTSLLPKLQREISEGEQVWHIKNIGELVLFQSFSSLYLYDISTDEIRRANTSPGDFISNLYEVDKRIYFQVGAKGLFELRQSGSQLVIPPEVLGSLTIVHLYKRAGKLRLITEDAKIMEWRGTELVNLRFKEQVLSEGRDALVIQSLSKDDPDQGLRQAQPDHLPVEGSFNSGEGSSSRLEGVSIFSALDVPGGLVLGTVAHGFYYISDAGEFQHFHQGNRLLNNTVLSLFLDRDQNLWAGFDQGLGMLDLNGQLELFEDRNGQLGSVYCSFQREGILYVGTNQGLYYRQGDSGEFTLIKGTNGQVWSLEEMDGSLFCGHNSGTFLVDGTKAEKIYEASGTWLVKKIPEQDTMYIQGHYNGVSLLKKEGSEFKSFPLLKGFPHSARYIVCDSGFIWVGNEHKGVFRFELSASLDSVVSLKNYTFPGNSGITSSIFSFNDSLYYSSREDILRYHPQKDSFLPDSRLARAIGTRERVSGRLLQTGNELWGFEKNSVFKLMKLPLKEEYQLRQVFFPEELRPIPIGNENISRFADGTYFLGMANGYIRFKNIPELTGDPRVRIDRIEKAALDKEAQLVPLKGAEAFHYKTNNLNFTYCIPKHKAFPKPVYSYRLLGQSEHWSPWNAAAEASFENLSYGDYEFQVRGKVGTLISEPERFSFSIRRPWYLSIPALVVYGLLFLSLLYGINKINTRRHLRKTYEREQALKLKHMEAEREIIALQNKHLEQDMEAKSKELAASTMNLIRKNEFLSKIKEELRSTGNGTHTAVLKTIEKEISGRDSWEFFKEAFNNADKDFFKKMKSKHPELTSNDLKLCAYLRLNLSSKEIAPLLNISVKSVEIKRYRLRKKMNLSRNVQLTDYILGV